MNRRFWMPARLSFGMSTPKDRIMGMPTPTTWPSPIWLEVRARLAGLAMVVNFTVLLVEPAVTVAVYSVPYLSCFAGIHSAPLGAGDADEPDEPGVAGAGAPSTVVPAASCRVTVASADDS